MYYKRLIEHEIERKLKTSGAVLVAGPRLCGKTTTCMLYQKSFIKLNTLQTITMARLGNTYLPAVRLLSTKRKCTTVESGG